MKTKEQRINEMLGKVYGFVETGKIEIIFSGKIGTVKVMLKNRRQVLEVLRRFYRDEHGIMDWVDTVIINNPYEGWVKVNGVWTWRKKVIEIKITKKSRSTTTKKTKKEAKKLVDTWVEIKGLEGIKANWAKLALVDDFINTKQFKTVESMKRYISKLKKTKAAENQQQFQFDIQRHAESSSTSTQETDALIAEIENLKKRIAKLENMRVHMTIRQLEELVNNLKHANDKEGSPVVRVTIDDSETLNFYQYSGYPECVGKYYSYSNN